MKAQEGKGATHDNESVTIGLRDLNPDLNLSTGSSPLCNVMAISHMQGREGPSLWACVCPLSQGTNGQQAQRGS